MLAIVPGVFKSLTSRKGDNGRVFRDMQVEQTSPDGRCYLVDLAVGDKCELPELKPGQAVKLECVIGQKARDGGGFKGFYTIVQNVVR